MKKVLLVMCMIMAVLASACAQQVVDDSGTQQGRAVFAMTDAAADMGAVTSVKVTVESIKVHSAAEGWVEVSSAEKTYDLLQLKAENKNELMADVQIDEGTYDQVRLDISSVVVTDANGTHEAKLPSNELKITGKLVVEANSTAAATFDFIADESLHVTGNGKYIMAPVVEFESREGADVSVQSNNRVEIRGGDIKTDVKVGMDISGNVGAGLKIPVGTELDLDTSGMIKIGKQTKAEGKAGLNVSLA